MHINGKRQKGINAKLKNLNKNIKKFLNLSNGDGLGYATPAEGKAHKWAKERFGRDYSFTNVEELLAHDWGRVYDQIKPWLDKRTPDTTHGYDFQHPVMKLRLFRTYLLDRIDDNKNSTTKRDDRSDATESEDE